MYVCIILVGLINNKKIYMGIFRNEERISKLGLNVELEGIILRGSLKCKWE
jgi:hypothetical protein